MPPVGRAKEGVMACHGDAATPSDNVRLTIRWVRSIVSNKGFGENDWLHELGD